MLDDNIEDTLNRASMSYLKKSLLVLSFALASVSSFASEEDDQNFCSAFTTCPSLYGVPYTISCQATGQGCTYAVIPGQAVQCIGYDAYGRWVTVAFRCTY